MLFYLINHVSTNVLFVYFVNPETFLNSDCSALQLWVFLDSFCFHLFSSPSKIRFPNNIPADRKYVHHLDNTTKHLVHNFRAPSSRRFLIENTTFKRQVDKLHILYQFRFLIQSYFSIYSFHIAIVGSND